jgi:hypothetical protein
MASFVRAGSIVGLVLLTTAPASAATQKEIDAAVQKGTDFLKARYRGPRQGVAPDNIGHGIGPTALAGIALIEAKTPASDPGLQVIAAIVRDSSFRETKTYSVALCLIFLDRLEDPADVPLIQMLAVRLLAGQNNQGGWGYDCTEAVPQGDEQLLRTAFRINQNNQLSSGLEPNPPRSKPPAQPKPGTTAKPVAAGKLHPDIEKYAAALWANRQPNRGDDNSNTQFGVMGVWIARKHGVPVEAALDLIEKRFLATQDQTGGWSYNSFNMPGMLGTNTPSMTCAGLLGISTAVARREERLLKHEAAPKEKEPAAKSPKSTDPFFNPTPTPKTDKPSGKKPADAKRQPDARDQAVKAGMANLGAVLTAATRAGGLLGNGTRQGDRDLYFLWSLERVGVIFGVEKIGGVDWYAHGADALVRAQGPDGSWGASGYGPEPGTAFAVLFLTRANIARDLSSKVQQEAGATELRAGNGPGATEATPTTKPPAPTATPGGSPALPKPLPTPAEDGAARLAADLVKAPDWSKALEHTRDAKGSDYTRALVFAVHQLSGDRKKAAREALAERLTRMTAETLQGMTKAEDPELRRGAVLACAMKDDKTHVPHLIDRLTDDEDLVVRAARAGLKSLTGQDFGPVAGASKEQRKAAADAWQTWWANRK